MKTIVFSSIQVLLFLFFTKMFHFKCLNSIYLMQISSPCQLILSALESRKRAAASEDRKSVLSGVRWKVDVSHNK